MTSPTSSARALRWKHRTSRFVVPDRVIDPRLLSVEPMSGDREAKAFVVTHHYSGCYPSASFRFGLYLGPFLVGVAIFSTPQNYASLSLFPGDPRESTELGRFVLLDKVPFNAETFFLKRCFGHLKREGITGVISFSDPFPRSDLAGRVVFPGHIGTIYQAFGATYVGRSRADTIRLLPDGSEYANRTAAKVRAGRHEQGFDYAVQRLVDQGAQPLRRGENPAAWLARELPLLTRAVKHPGKHKYAWLLDRHARWSDDFTTARRARSHVSVAVGLLGSPYPKRSPSGMTSVSFL